MKAFFQQKKLSAGKILVEKFYEYKQNQLPLLLKEIAEYETLVAQKKQLVAQIQVECDTNMQRCDTIFKEFVKQGRDIRNPTAKDQFWLEARLEKYGVAMKVDEFIFKYQDKKLGGKK